MVRYLGFAGLKLDEVPGATGGQQQKKFKIVHISEPNDLQRFIFKSWLGEN